MPKFDLCPYCQGACDLDTWMTDLEAIQSIPCPRCHGSGKLFLTTLNEHNKCHGYSHGGIRAIQQASQAMDLAVQALWRALLENQQRSTTNNQGEKK